MLKAPRHLGFFGEARLDLFQPLSGRGFRGERLQRDRPLDLGIVREVDHAHRAMAENAGNLIAPEAVAELEHHDRKYSKRKSLTNPAG